jgi:hypothetical protein
MRFTEVSQPTKLSMESLENREVPAAFGVPWGNAQNLTVSFAADGVKVAPYEQVNNWASNSLYSSLGKNMSQATWQDEALKAVQTWAAPANINVGLIPDNNMAFGPDGASFSAAKPADLRYGAIPQSNEVAAITTPYNLISGNRAGDVILNANTAFTVGGANGTKDLYSVLLNESANALGLSDTNTQSSARYGRYTGVRSGLSTTDVTDIQAMYGARQNDGFEGLFGNSTIETATPLTSTLTSGIYIAFADASIASLSDVDTYKVSTLGNTSTVQVRLNTAGVSLFTGTVEVYNSAKQLVATKSITTPTQGDISMSFVANPNINFWVRVKPSQQNVFGVGTYKLRVGLNADPKPLEPAAVLPYVKYGTDGGTDNLITGARNLTYTTPGYAANTNFTVRGVIESGSDRDMYAVTVPLTSKPMSITIDPGQSFQIQPEVHVFSDVNYKWVQPTKLVQSTDGRWVAQFPGQLAGTKLYLGVKNIDGVTTSGEYEMTVDFNTPVVETQTLVQGITSTANSLNTVSLAVPESTFFHFGVEAWNTPSKGTGTHILMSIINSAGTTVATLSANSGLNSMQTYLMAGNYTVRFQSKDSNGNNNGGANYKWSAMRLSDPIDVYDPLDPGNQTPPVVVKPVNPIDDIWFISNPWSDPIGG